MIPHPPRKPTVPDLFASVLDDKVMRTIGGPPAPVPALLLTAVKWIAALALLVGLLWALWQTVGCAQPIGPSDAAQPFCCRADLGCTRPDDPACCGAHPAGCPCAGDRDCHPDTLGTGWVCLPCTGRD